MIFAYVGLKGGFEVTIFLDFMSRLINFANFTLKVNLK